VTVDKNPCDIAFINGAWPPKSDEVALWFGFRHNTLAISSTSILDQGLASLEI
jgi:hypothetical protein